MGRIWLVDLIWLDLASCPNLALGVAWQGPIWQHGVGQRAAQPQSDLMGEGDLIQPHREEWRGGVHVTATQPPGRGGMAQHHSTCGGGVMAWP